MTAETQNVRVGLAAKPENVTLIREVLAGLGDAVDLGGTLEDIKAAVSEAANNVVRHAYAGEDGPMEVEISLEPNELEVLVRDHGAGVGPRAVDDSFPGRGIGLVVIDALTSSWELRAGALGGVEVVMRFPIPAHAALAADTTASREESLGGDAQLALTISPASLSAAILNRFVTGVAARAGFSIDRVSDAQLVADALAAALASSLVGDRVNVGVDIGPGRLLLRLGPLRAGASTAVVDGAAVAELGPIVRRLVDGSSSALDGTGELLTLEMLDRRNA